MSSLSQSDLLILLATTRHAAVWVEVKTTFAATSIKSPLYAGRSKTRVAIEIVTNSLWANFEDTIQDTKIENLKLVTSNVDLSGLEVETANENRRAFLLKDKIENFINSQKNDFSYIFIDCPPSLSLLTVMSLVVAKSLIVPLQAEFFALEGLSQLMKTIDRVKIKLNPQLEIRGVLLTMYDRRNKLSAEVDAEARNFFKGKVYQTVIPRNVRPVSYTHLTLPTNREV